MGKQRDDASNVYRRNGLRREGESARGLVSGHKNKVAIIALWGLSELADGL